MADVKASTGEPGDRIGSGGAGTRTSWIVMALVVVGVVVGLVVWRSGSGAVAQAPEPLQRFRAAIATECKLEAFAEPADERVIAAYNGSSRMQLVITEQLGMLKRGQANCDQIVKVLKTVNYPVE